MRPHKPAEHVQVGDDIYITAHDHGPVKRIERHERALGRFGPWLAFIVHRDIPFAGPGTNVAWFTETAPVQLHVEEDMA